MKTVAVSGHFDPLHVGHIIHMKLAKLLGDRLVVIVNSDESSHLKHGFCLIPQRQRMAIIRELNFVDEVVAGIDDADTIAKTLQLVCPNIFAKGGDRTLDNIPQAEKEVCEAIGCEIVTGVNEVPPFHSSTDFILDTVQKFEGLGQ